MKKTNSTSTTKKATPSFGDYIFNMVFTLIFTIVTITILVLGVRADMQEHPTLTTPEERATMHIEEPEEDVLSAYIDTNEVR